MGDLPPPDTIAAALILVGFLFCLRYWLALRRLKAAAPGPAPAHGLFEAPKAGAYGDSMEPNRRYAVRQYWQAVIFLAGGVCVAAWVILTGQPITIGQGA